jgi:hypothetical protein
LTAGPELPCVASVVRVTSAELGAPAPAKCQTAVAFAVNVPGSLLLIVTVQVAVFPVTVGTAQVLVIEPGAGETCGVSEVKVAVVPAGMAVVEMVNTCWWPTSFTPLGVTLTFASTNRLIAGPELPWVESVVRVTSALFAPSVKCQTASAVAVKTPGSLLEIVTVQVAVLPVTVGFAQVSEIEPGAGETCGVIEVSEAVVPAPGSAVVEIVNTC